MPKRVITEQKIKKFKEMLYQQENIRIRLTSIST